MSITNFFDKQNTKQVLWNILMDEYDCDVSVHPRTGRPIQGLPDVRHADLLVRALFEAGGATPDTMRKHWRALAQLVTLDRDSMWRRAADDWGAGGLTKHTICLDVVGRMRERPAKHQSHIPINRQAPVLARPGNAYILVTKKFALLCYSDWLNGYYVAGGSELPIWNLLNGRESEEDGIRKRSIEALKLYQADVRERVREKAGKDVDDARAKLEAERMAARDLGSGYARGNHGIFYAWRKLQLASMHRVMADIISLDL